MLPVVAIDALVDHVTESCDAIDVEVRALGVGADALLGADEVLWEGDPCGTHPTLRLELFHEGKVAARYTVKPSLMGHRSGPVAEVDLAKDAPVRWVMGPVPLGTNTIESPGGLLTRPVKAGEPLTQGSLRAAPDVAEGAVVTIIVTRGELSLSAPGTLLREGSLGETVRVRNDTNHVALTGVLTAPDRVEIR